MAVAVAAEASVEVAEKVRDKITYGPARHRFLTPVGRFQPPQGGHQCRLLRSEQGRASIGEPSQEGVPGTSFHCAFMAIA